MREKQPLPPAAPREDKSGLHDLNGTRPRPVDKPVREYQHKQRHRMAGQHDGLRVTEHHRGRRVK